MSLTRARRQRATSSSASLRVESQQERPVSISHRSDLVPRVAQKTRSSDSRAAMPHWQQSQRWFWFGEAFASEARELVVPLGESFEQGPHVMTRFRTQDGRIRSCSVEYFERNTELCTTMRRPVLA